MIPNLSVKEQFSRQSGRDSGPQEQCKGCPRLAFIDQESSDHEGDADAGRARAEMGKSAAAIPKVRTPTFKIFHLKHVSRQARNQPQRPLGYTRGEF